MSSFVRRVALGGFLIAAVAALTSALVTGGIALTLLERAEDGRLLEASGVLAAELREDRPVGDEIRAAVEAESLEHTGLSFAVFGLDGQLLAGERHLQPVKGAACATAGTGWRGCAVSTETFIVVAASSQPSRQPTFLLAGLLSALLVAALALIASRPFARSLVAPLSELQGTLAALKLEAITHADLGPSSKVAEVETLRSTIALLLTRIDGALQQATRFAADAAHELRTPLATIHAELELMAEGETTPEAIARVTHTVWRLSMLVERLLVLATPDDATTRGELVSIDELVEDVVAALPESERARVLIEREASFAVQGDPSLLSALISNALSNALKFGTRVTVHIAAKVLRFEDDGPGIPEAERTRVFEALYRTEHARRARIAGHGLGLSIIAHVARRHQAHASFEPSTRGAKLVVQFT